MTAAAPAIAAPRLAPAGTGRLRVALAWLAIVVAILFVWEGAKWLFGDPWRIHGSLLGLPIDIEHDPPLRAYIASDLALPHIWTILDAFVEPAQRGGVPLGVVLAGQALATFREAVIGFIVGGLLGLLLG